MKVELLVTIETDDFDSAEGVKVALENRIDGWDVDAKVELVGSSEVLEARLFRLNHVIRAAKREIDLLEEAREKCRADIREHLRQDLPK